MKLGLNFDRRLVGTGAAFIALSIAALAIMSQLDVLANTKPLTVVVLILLAAVATHLAYATYPEPSLSHLHARLAVAIPFTTIAIYSTGWGSALLLGYLRIISANASISGSQAYSSGLLWIPPAVLIGELAIATDHAPSSLPQPEGHGLAGLVTLCTVYILVLILQATREAEHVERAVRRSEVQFRALTQHASDVIVVLDDQLRVRYASDSLNDTLGYSFEALEDVVILGLVHPDELPATRTTIDWARKHPGESITNHLRIRHATGDWRWVETNTASLLEDHVQGIVVTIRDVTEYKEIEDSLARLAYYDSLTGLPNRAWLQERLEQAVARAQRHRRPVAVIFVDLDGFKEVNDRFGHEAGDAVLMEVAARLRTCLRRDDSAAHLGGDEFMIVLEDLERSESAELVAQQIIDAHRVAFVVGNNQVLVTASAGIALTSLEDAIDAVELLRRADAAMYLAKAKGKCRYETYVESAALLGSPHRNA